jgi:hypothetical protein
MGNTLILPSTNRVGFFPGVTPFVSKLSSPPPPNSARENNLLVSFQFLRDARVIGAVVQSSDRKLGLFCAPAFVRRYQVSSGALQQVIVPPPYALPRSGNTETYTGEAVACITHLYDHGIFFGVVHAPGGRASSRDYRVEVTGNDVCGGAFEEDGRMMAAEAEHDRTKDEAGWKVRYLNRKSSSYTPSHVIAWIAGNMERCIFQASPDDTLPRSRTNIHPSPIPRYEAYIILPYEPYIIIPHEAYLLLPCEPSRTTR